MAKHLSVGFDPQNPFNPSPNYTKNKLSWWYKQTSDVSSKEPETGIKVWKTVRR